jgi:hypothetical protein
MLIVGVVAIACGTIVSAFVHIDLPQENIIEEIGKSIQYSCEEGEFDTIIINDNILDINDVDFILDFLNNIGYEARLVNEDKDKATEYPYSIFISWVHGNEKNKKK